MTDDSSSDPPPRSARAGDGQAGGRLAVVVNGNAKSVTSEVIETLDQILDGGDLFVSRRVEESEGIARTLVDRGYDTILTGAVTDVHRRGHRRDQGGRRRQVPLPPSVCSAGHRQLAAWSRRR